jgi:hypothetical protein
LSPAAVCPGQGGDDVEVQRLADRSGFLGAVQHPDRVGGVGEHGKERLGWEWPVQTHLHHANALTACCESGGGLGGGLRTGTHQDQHPFGLGVSRVVDDVHPPAGACGQLHHQVVDDLRHPGIERVHRLPALEVGIGVLCGAADEGPLRRHAASSMVLDQILGDQRPQILVGEQIDRVQLV